VLVLCLSKVLTMGVPLLQVPLDLQLVETSLLGTPRTDMAELPTHWMPLLEVPTHWMPLLEVLPDLRLEMSPRQVMEYELPIAQLLEELVML
jgi:hypothetical protein